MPLPFQVLTGACNTNGQCVASGQAHGADILAYGSGSNLFILDSKFERLQIIQDKQNRLVTAVACSNNGNVFVAIEDEINVYQVSSLKDCLEDRISWRWVCSVEARESVRAISCDAKATRLLASSGCYLQLWEKVKDKSFSLGGKFVDSSAINGNSAVNGSSQGEWRNISTVELESSVNKLQFSPDGSFFASSCENDPVLKVWYKNDKDTEVLSNTAPYAFTYLPHPYPVCSFSWRQNAYETFGENVVANAVLSVCSDHICRVWLEMAANPSHLSYQQSSQTPHSTASTVQGTPLGPNRKAPSVVKVNFVENSCVFESFRQFHLVASISPVSDLPSPVLGDYLSTHPNSMFCVFWLNNKHMATLETLDRLENSYQKQSKTSKNGKMKDGIGRSSSVFKIGPDDDAESLDEDHVDTGSEETGYLQNEQSSLALQSFKRLLKIDKKARIKLSPLQYSLLRREWVHSPDMVISFSPADGSFLLWTIDHLDKADGASFVQPSVTFTSCLPSTLPPSDAVSLLPSPLILYSDPHDHATLVSVHDNGTLNQWSLSISEKTKHSTLISLYHGQRICGHRTGVEHIVVHPLLPIVVTHSPGELVFWKVTQTTQLHQSGGFAEVTRMVLTGTWNYRLAWVPTSFSGSYSPCGISPSTVFILRSVTGFSAMQVIIDAYTFFSRLKKKSILPNSQSRSLLAENRLGIVSQQSASRPACVIKISHLQADNSHDFCHFFHVFPIASFPLIRNYLMQRVSDNTGSANNSNEVAEFIAVQMVATATGVLKLQSYYIAISSPLSKPNSMEGISSPVTDGHLPLQPSLSSQSLSPEAKMCVLIEPISSIEMVLPLGVGVNHAEAAVCQQSSSFLSNLFSPFHIVMGCTDRKVRFWSGYRTSDRDLNWSEWRMPADAIIGETGDSSIQPRFFDSNPNGRILLVSNAFSARLAVLSGRNNTPSSIKSSVLKRPNSLTINPFCCEVDIYECESSGGYKWNIEDTVELTYDTSSQLLQDMLNASDSVDPLTAVKIRWSPVHDGSHLLVVLLLDRIYVYAQISTEIALQLNLNDEAKASKGADTSSTSTPQTEKPIEKRHGLLQHTPLMATQSNSSQIEGRHPSGVSWVRIRVFELTPAATWNTGPVLPTFVSLLQTGLLVVGLGSELQIFSQWQGSSKAPSKPALKKVEVQKKKAPSPVPSNLSVPIGLNIVSPEDSVQAATVVSPTSPEGRSLADNVWLSVSSASFLQMHRSASFQSLAKHTGAEVMASTAEVPIPTTPASTIPRAHKPISVQNKKMPTIAEQNNDQATAAIRVLEDASLYELALATNPVLPQYHPKFLLELLKIGRVHCVDSILAHVVQSIFPDIHVSSNGEPQGDELDENAAEDAAVDKFSSATKQHVAAGNMSAMSGTGQDGDEASHLNAVFVRPIPLHELWEQLNSSARIQHKHLSSGGASTAEKLMSQVSISDPNDALNGHSGLSHSRTNSMSVHKEPAVFTEAMARMLSVFLSRSRLPGLSNLDQMYLLALSGLVSARTGHADPGTQLYSQTLDACGSRFLLDMRHHDYLTRSLPMAHRIKLIQRGLSSISFLWAFHSESQDELLSLIPSIQKGEPNWSELRSYGVGYWLRNITAIRKLGEQLARSSFQKTRDPLDSAMFYLAMKKKSLLAVLFKNHENVRMREFFKNDFNEERWRKAALKNAFDLLAKQRFQHAVAFFLLANSLHDAVEVCLSRLNDMQLALLISRLHDESGEAFMKLMKIEILGVDSSKKRSTDPFLLSLAHWVVGEHQLSLRVLLESSRVPHSDEFGHMTAVFGFYCHLKGHPLMRKLTAGRSTEFGNQSLLLSTHLERKAHFLTAHSYLKAGCPILALNVLNRMPGLADSPEKGHHTTKKPPDAPKQESKAEDMDWSQPVSGTHDDELVLDWSDEDGDESGEENEKDSEEPKEQEEIKSSPKLFVTTENGENPVELDEAEGEVAKFICPSTPEFGTSCVSEQLKFICCLRLLADELTALCGGQTSTQLHQQLFTWLQNEFRLVSSMVSDRNSYVSSSSKTVQLPLIMEAGGDVHHLLENLTERRKWLAENSHLLHCLLNFASLLAPTSTPLSLALNELCQLSQDLYAPKSSLSCKLPATSSLPLVLAALSPLRSCFQNVVSILFNLASDVLLYLSSLDQIWPPTPELMSKLRAVRDLSLILSSSVYQSLCGSDLDPGRLRVVTTEPTKWPGVSQWTAMLQQFADPDCPRLYLLLTRCLIAVHSGIFVYALSSSDPKALFRLLANPLNLPAWNRVFGGAKRMPVRHHQPPNQNQPAPETATGPSGPAAGADKHRSAINRRVLDQRRPSEADKIVYTEEFIPPTTTMASYFLRKPEPNLSLDFDTAKILNFDDTEELDEDEVIDLDNREHIDPNSRSWMLMRIAVIEYVTNMYRHFLPGLGVEHQDLIQLFPLVHGVILAMERWSISAQQNLRALGPPPPVPEFVPDRTVLPEPVGTIQNSKPFDKYACLIKPENTPFTEDSSSLLHRRLWLFLIRHDLLKAIFIREIFGRTTADQIQYSGSQTSLIKPDNSSETSSTTRSTLPGKTSVSMLADLAVKMIHKDQEAVGAFCINQNNLNCVAVALSKETLQLDIGVMLHPPTWVESDLEYDIESMRTPQPSDGCNSFTVVHARHNTNSPSHSASFANLSTATNSNLPPSAPGVIPAAINQTGASAITAYGANVLKNFQTPFQLLDRSRRLVKQFIEEIFDDDKSVVTTIEFPSQPEEQVSVAFTSVGGGKLEMI